MTARRKKTRLKASRSDGRGSKVDSQTRPSRANRSSRPSKASESTIGRRFWRLDGGVLTLLAKRVNRSPETLKRWKREGFPQKSQALVKEILEGSRVVPLTERERKQVAVQRRLAHAEVSRLKAKRRSELRKIKRRIALLEKRLSIVDGRREELQDQISELRAEAKVKLEPQPQQDIRTIIPIAKEREYTDKQVHNIHVNDKGWILGNITDDLGKPIPVRCWTIYNSETGDFTVRWLGWFPYSRLPKKGATDTQEDYEELKPSKYFVYGVFHDSKKLDEHQSELLDEVDELEAELSSVLHQIALIENELKFLRGLL